MIKKLREHFIMAKFALLRSNSYISLMNAGMILFLVLSTLKQYGYISLDLGKYLVPIYALGVVVLLTLGYFEIYVAKGMQTEQALGYKLNPEWNDLKFKIDYIYNKLK